jgi:hypothetical protein
MRHSGCSVHIWRPLRHACSGALRTAGSLQKAVVQIARTFFCVHLRRRERLLQEMVALSSVVLAFVLMLSTAAAQRGSLRASDITQLCSGIVEYSFIIPEVRILSIHQHSGLDDLQALYALCPLKCSVCVLQLSSCFLVVAYTMCAQSYIEAMLNNKALAAVADPRLSYLPNECQVRLQIGNHPFN